jgi:YVTN family beta-propeller protein
LINKSGSTLFVANANRNTVSVFDTITGKPLATIGTSIAPNAPAGSTPNSLALSPDESLLFVTNANTNDGAVVNVTNPARSQALGFIPVGWYPTSVRISKDGKTLYVTSRWAARLSVVDLVAGRLVRQVRVGRSPHGVWTLDHAAR